MGGCASKDKKDKVEVLEVVDGDKSVPNIQRETNGDATPNAEGCVFVLIRFFFKSGL